MNKKEKSAWAIFFTSVALSFVFVSLLSFKGCGCNSGGSGGSHPKGSGRVYPNGVCVEKNDFFRCPEASLLVSALNDAKSDMDKLKVWNEFRDFFPKGASYLKPEHDRIIEQLENKEPLDSRVDGYKRAVSSVIAFLGKEKDQNTGIPTAIAVAGRSIKEGIFRKARRGEENKYRKIGRDFSNINSQEYKKYRLIEDYNFESDGSLSPSSNGDIFFIEKFPTVNFWFKTKREKDLALEGVKSGYVESFIPFPLFVKKSELLSIDSFKKLLAATDIEAGRLKPLKLKYSEPKDGKPEMIKIGDVTPKRGSNLRELWVCPFAIKAKTEDVPLVSSFYLVKIHVG